MVCAAHRDMQLIRRHDAEISIAEFPPELVSDDCHVQRRSRLFRILDSKDDPRGREEQNNHDEHRDYGPCQLNSVASIHLRGLYRLVSPSSIAEDDKEQK